MTSIFECKSIFYCPVSILFDFHENKIGFETLVGGEKGVEVISEPGSLSVGSIARLKVPILPFLKVNWVSEHTEYEKNRLFQDVQKEGPFQIFKHSHIFEEYGPDSVLLDRIEFKFFLQPISKYFIYFQLASQFKRRHLLTAKTIGVKSNLQHTKIY